MHQNVMNSINPFIIHCGHRSRQNVPVSGTKYLERQVAWYELELIIWGEGYITTDGKNLKANRGDLFFRKPGMVVQGVLPYYSYIIVFDMVYDSEKADLYEIKGALNARVFDEITRESLKLAKKPEPFDFPNVINTTGFPLMENLFNSCFNEFIQKKPDMQFFLKSCLFRILSLAYSQWSNAIFSENARRSIKQNYSRVLSVKKYIDLNSKKHISLCELSEVADLSPNFLCKIFKEIEGIPPIEYVNKTRINLAKSLLVETQKTIKDISYECGFDNDTYFYTIFKRMEGISPSVFREQHYSIFTK